MNKSTIGPSNNKKKSRSKNKDKQFDCFGCFQAQNGRAIPVPRGLRVCYLIWNGCPLPWMFHSSFLCNACNHKLQYIHKEYGPLCQDYENLIVKFPDIIIVTNFIAPSNLDWNLLNVLKAYKTCHPNLKKGDMNRMLFNAPISQFKSNHECILLPYSIGTQIKITKQKGCPYYGDYELHGVVQDDSNINNMIIIKEILSNRKGEVSIRRIIMPDFDLKNQKSISQQASDCNKDRYIQIKDKELDNRKKKISRLSQENAVQASQIEELQDVAANNALTIDELSKTSQRMSEELNSVKVTLKNKKAILADLTKQLELAFVNESLSYVRGQHHSVSLMKEVEQLKKELSEQTAYADTLAERLSEVTTKFNDMKRDYKQSTTLIDELKDKADMAYSRGQHGLLEVIAQKDKALTETRKLTNEVERLMISKKKDQDEAAIVLHELEEMSRKQALLEVQASVAYRNGAEGLLNEQAQVERQKEEIETLTKRTQSIEADNNRLRVNIHRLSVNQVAVTQPDHIYETRSKHQDADEGEEDEDDFMDCESIEDFTCLEFLARHKTSVELNNIDIDNDVKLKELAVTIKEQIEAFGFIVVLSIIESLMPVSFWIFVGSLAYQSLHHFVTSIVGGQIDCRNWANLFLNHVPGAWVLFMTYATTNKNERNGDVTEPFLQKQMSRTMAVISIMCLMIDPRCSHIMQKSMSLLLTQGKRITVNIVNICNQLGFLTSDTAHKADEKILIDKGVQLSQDIIKIAIKYGYTITMIFDNVDWLGVHVMHFIVWISKGPSAEVREQRTRCDLNKLTKTRFKKDATEAEASMNRSVCRIANALSLKTDEYNKTFELVKTNNSYELEKKLIRKSRFVKKIAALEKVNIESPPLSADPAKQSKRYLHEKRSMDQEDLTWNKEFAKVLVSYDPIDVFKDDRHMNEAKPLCVKKDELVEVIIRFPSIKCAAVISSQKAYGWIPLFCLTKDTTDLLHGTRSEYLITPRKLKLKTNFADRMEAVKFVCQGPTSRVLDTIFEDEVDAEEDYIVEEEVDDAVEEDDEKEDEENNEKDDESSDHDTLEVLTNNMDIDDNDVEIEEVSVDMNEEYAKIKTENQKNSAIFDDDYIKEVDEKVKESGNVKSVNVHSCVSLSTSVGSSAKCADISMAMNEAEERIPLGDDGLPYKSHVNVSDSQEFLAMASNQDARRGAIVRDIKSLKKSRNNDSVALNDEILRLTSELTAIDTERAHFWGPFHGVMGGIRGWSRTFGEFLLRPLMAWAGYSSAYESIIACKYGYYKMGIDLFSSLNYGWINLAIGLYTKLDIDQTVSSFEKIQHLTIKSRVFAFYDMIIRLQLNPLLDMDDAGKLQGVDAMHLLGSSMKDMIGWYAMNGNYNLTYAVAYHLRLMFIGDKDQTDSYYCSPTAYNQKTGHSVHHDMAMEAVVRELKQLLGKYVHENTVESKSMLLNSAAGKIEELFNNCFGSKTDFVDPTADSKRTIPITETTARMHVALDTHLSDWILKDINHPNHEDHINPSNKKNKKICEETEIMPIVSGPSQPRKTMVVIRDYVGNWAKFQKEREERVLNFILRDSIGGTCKSDSKTKSAFQAYGPIPKTKKQTIISLTNSKNKMLLFLAMLVKNNPDALREFGLMCIYYDGSLRKAIKSKSREACEIEFYKKSNFKPVKYCKNPNNCAEIYAVTDAPITISYMVHTVIWDGNMWLRRGKDVEKSDIGIISGAAVILNHNYQIMREEINVRTPFKRKLFNVFDVGCGEAKGLENYKRDKLKTTKNVITPTIQVNDVVKDPNILMNIYSDRVNRHKLMETMGDVMNSEHLNGLISSHKNDRLIQALKRNPNVTIGFAGIGHDEDRRRTRVLNYIDGAFTHSDSATTHHDEDTKLIYLAVIEILDGRNVLIKANDTDIWMIAMLAVSKYIDHPEYSNLGTIFVETTDRIVDDVKTNLINCNEAAKEILNDKRFNHIPENMRLTTFVVIMVSMGGDKTHATKGVTHIKGLSHILKHLDWIGELVREATFSEKQEGSFFEINFESYKRMQMIIFTELNHSAICDRWGSKGKLEQQKFLEENGYVKLTKIIAEVALDTLGFMVSEPNLVHAMGRTWLCTHEWFVSALANPKPVLLRGLDIICEGDNGVEKRVQSPKAGEIPVEKRIRTEPTFTRNSQREPFNVDFKEIFPESEGGTLGALNRKRSKEVKKKSKSKRSCGKCCHEFHGKEPCAVCGVDECIEVCKKCLHPPHKGTKCIDCEGLCNRGYCTEFCRDCRLQKKVVDGCTCVVENASESGDDTGISAFSENENEVERNVIELDPEEVDNDDICTLISNGIENEDEGGVMYNTMSLLNGGADDEANEFLLTPHLDDVETTP